MSTHNICLYGEIRTLLCGYPLLILHKNHAVFLGAFFFFVTETNEMYKIYKENPVWF